MIAVSSSGQSFGKLAEYLVKPRDGIDRVDWISARNLPTLDPLLAARFMQATAAANPRVIEPMYHVAVSFHPDDVVTQQTMERVADRLLAELKLQGHQVVIVAHKDRAHAHMHLMVNRVHPDTGRAWSRWQDWVTTQRVLRHEERALGLREVRGRLHQLPGQEPPDRARVTSGEHRQAERSGVEPLIERVRPHADELRGAKSWSELHTRLGEHGLGIERKGQGLVITDGDTQVKASRVHRDLSFGQLQARLGPYRVREIQPDISSATERPVQTHGSATAHFRGGDVGIGAPRDRDRSAEIAEAARIADRVHRLESLHFRAEHAHQNYQAGLRNLESAAKEARTAPRAFDTILTRVYVRPDEARARFDALARSAGPDAARQRMCSAPRSFGELRRHARPVAWGLVKVRDTREALRLVPQSAERGRHAVETAARLREQIRQLSPARSGATRERADGFAQALAHTVERVRHWGARVDRFEVALAGRPDSRALDTALGQAVMSLAPPEVRRVVQLLTNPQRAVMEAAVRLAKDLVLGRSLGR